MSDTTFEAWDELAAEIAELFDRIADEEGASKEAAIEDLWDLVDAFSDRLYAVDIDSGGDEAVDSGDGTVGIDGIPDSLAAVDPARTVKLGSLVRLVGVGRRSDVVDVEDYLARSDADDTGRDGEDSAAAAEEIDSAIREAIDEFREGIAEARGESDESGGETEPDEDEDGSPESGDSPKRTDPSDGASRSAAPLSTVPSSRPDIGGVTHGSIPTRSRPPSTRSKQSDDED